MCQLEVEHDAEVQVLLVQQPPCFIPKRGTMWSSDYTADVLLACTIRGRTELNHSNKSPA